MQRTLRQETSEKEFSNESDEALFGSEAVVKQTNSGLTQPPAYVSFPQSKLFLWYSRVECPIMRFQLGAVNLSPTLRHRLGLRIWCVR